MGLIISIIVAVIFSESVKSKIKNGLEFNGVGWGLLCGIFGAGLIPAGIAYSSVNTALKNSNNSPEYNDYATQELKSFWKTYIICFICWIALYIIGFFVLNVDY